MLGLVPLPEVQGPRFYCTTLSDNLIHVAQDMNDLIPVLEGSHFGLELLHLPFELLYPVVLLFDLSVTQSHIVIASEVVGKVGDLNIVDP